MFKGVVPFLKKSLNLVTSIVKSSYKMAHHSIEYHDQVLVIGREERLELRIFAGICFVQ